LQPDGAEHRASPCGVIVVVTGGNGLDGFRLCAALTQRGAGVRAVVRRPGAAPAVRGVAEQVGDFTDTGFAATVLADADAAVTTVHPMGSDEEVQRRIGVDGTTTFARAAAATGVERFVHVSTAAVHDRSPAVRNVDEFSPLVGDAGDYAVTERDADLAVAAVDGLTRVLLRPPAVLGAGESSIWNTLRPAAIRDDEAARHAVPDQTFAWVHVDDLVTLAAEVATARVPASTDPAAGPVADACTPVSVAAGPATVRDYYETVTRAVGVTPVWEDAEAWTGRLLADRAHGWGWTPAVGQDRARELRHRVQLARHAVAEVDDSRAEGAGLDELEIDSAPAPTCATSRSPPGMPTSAQPSVRSRT
jgi:2-alkyl-3-oxoalkanoate reductase